MSDGTLPPTEGADPRYESLHLWPTEIAALALWEAQMSAVAAVRPALPAIAAAAEAAASRLRDGGRLVYCGAGTSGRIGVQDGAELPPTFDWPEDRLVLLIAGGPAALTQAVENAEDRADQAVADLAAHDVGAADVVIGIAASGSTPYAVASLAEAGRRGALTIAVTNSPASALAAAATHALIAATGAEAVAGSTRLKAGTAQKVMLNLLSTLTMLRLHRVHRGRMVDMVARNEKLRRRAVRMVAELAGCDATRAEAALAATGDRVKPAVLVAGGATAADASRLLLTTDGNLGEALLGLNPAGSSAPRA